jgi:mycothiol synthase
VFQEWLNLDQRSKVAALAEHVATADGPDNGPLNEEGRRNLHEAAGHLLRWEGGRLVGYLQHDLRMNTAQLMVEPEFRRRGIASGMLAELGRGVPVWAFGNLPAAQGLAAKLSYRVGRKLLIMERDGSGAAHTPSGRDSGLTIRGYTPDDLDPLVQVNAAAFAEHPEQGRMTRADFAARMKQEWFDPDGLLLGFDAEGLAAFHWTKIHPDQRGEVYAVGVAPRAQQQGYGKVILEAGLEHLRQVGVQTVFLYVDAAEVKPVTMYSKAGFTQVHADVLYLPGDQP